MKTTNCMFVAVSVLLTFKAIAADEAKPVQREPAAETVSTRSDAARASLLGVDADGDGIRDDIEAIVAKSEVTPSSDAPDASPTASALASLREAKTVHKPPQRRTCMEYMLMGSKERAKTDLRMQQRTSGIIGTHPCDPVVSPLLDRPFETDFAHLDLGPISLRY